MSILTKIAAKETATKFVLETDALVVFPDIDPIAPIHLLILPKKHYRDLQSIPDDEIDIVMSIVKAARQLALKYNVENQYRLLTNVGLKAGQSQFHLHFHFLAGRQLGTMG